VEREETFMHQTADRKGARGFTLVGTMTALAVVSILTATGVPQLSNLAGAKAAESTITALASAIRLARVEAIKRGEPVSVCAIDPQSKPHLATCAEGGKDWSAGWLVFVDRGTRGEFDDDDVRVRVDLPARARLQVQATLRYVTFQPSGVSLTAASHFDVLPGGDATAYGARRVCVNKPGRLRVLSSVQECDV
jgi:type IV fimbrial biogenesis protein FimT